MDSLIKGLHHITLVTKNYKINNSFYTEILGLERVKLSVNQDDIFHRHLFYANKNLTVGSTITFFEWPFLNYGRIGLGSPHHLSYETYNPIAVIKWKVWLKQKGLKVKGPYIRFNNYISIYFRDYDGTIIEIISKNEDKVSLDYLKENEKDLEIYSITQDMKLIRFNHATPLASSIDIISKFHEKILGLKVLFKEKNPDDDNILLGIGLEEPFLIYIVDPNVNEGEVGIGNIHHIALAVEDERDQIKIFKKLEDAYIPNSRIVDRYWFKSLYFRDSEGNLLEIATKGPGYTRDESFENLGQKLSLPPWLEPFRKRIEEELNKLDKNNIIETLKVFDLSENPEKINI